MHYTIPRVLFFLLLVAPTLSEANRNCLEKALSVADAQSTIGEIRNNCIANPQHYDIKQATDETAVDEVIAVTDKRELEQIASENPYGISPHKRNYMMPFTYNRRPNGAPFGLADRELDQAEVKFQFSYKVPLLRQLMDKPIDLHFGYTNQSYWQAYNGSSSRPFRETNHEPEFFLTWTDPWLPSWADHAQYSLGLSHQSNGRSGDISRSWNRVYLSSLLQHRNYFLGVKIWNRINDQPKEFPGDPRGDDNPDIEKFMGHFEIEISRVSAARNFNVLLRNNLRSGDNFGAFQASYSFPLNKSLKAYLEYFEGYGESMIDYDHSVQRLGLGIAISDWP